MSLRGVAAAFDAIVMIALAFTVSGGSFADVDTDVVVWASAAAAIVAALVVLSARAPVLGWSAVGYIVFAAFLAAVRPIALLGLLALAFMPLLPRVRGSLLVGLGISAVTAVVAGAIVRAL